MMRKPLRYQISDWSQITECRSNNSKNLSLSLSKYLDGDTFKGLVISVKHVNYGTLFAALIQGSGRLLTDIDEDGYDVPCLTTDEILRQLLKFGFIIKYRVVEHLPNSVLVFLNTINDIGFDKITRVALEYINPDGEKIWRPTILVIKSQYNPDLLTFDCRLTRKKFNEKLAENTVMNVTHEPDMVWDWVSYIANIDDILAENTDPTDEFEPTRIKPIQPYPPVADDMTIVGSEEVVLGLEEFEDDIGGDYVDAGNEP